MSEIYVIGPRDKITHLDVIVINTTSKVKSVFSPFYSPTSFPIEAKRMENAWQFSKVYQNHDDNGQPTPEWFEWQAKGLKAKWAERYPMGKGAILLYSWYNGQQLDYISARKELYIPLYRNMLTEKHYQEIKLILNILRYDDVALWDYDGYLTNDSFDTIVNNPKRKMGHAFVLREVIKEQMSASEYVNA